MIDFSKAPEGATHYDDSTKTVGWWKMGPQGWVMTTGYFNGVPVWAGVAGCYALDFKEIPKRPNMLIECKTEREVMICEQVLRMLRGEESEYQFARGGEWSKCLDDSSLSIRKNYRAKPKKELVVPWEWLEPCITQVTVDDDKVVRVWDDNEKECYILPLNLDLTDIDLPVTVKRP